MKKSSNNISRYLEIFTEIIAWLVIVISLTCFAGLVGFFIAAIVGGISGFILLIIIGGIGLVASIIYACYIWQTKGTVNFISNSSWKNKIKEDTE